MRRLLPLLLALAACGDDATSPPDAPPAPDAAGPDAGPCGLAAPRCVDARTLERCNGAQLEQVDCSAAGAWCGPDPTAPSTSVACVAPGDACGQITGGGACAGDVLVFCSFSTGALKVVDCGERAATCGQSELVGGNDCVIPCDPGVTAEGECAGNAIRRCRYTEAGYVMVDDPCPAGTTCQTYDLTGWPACLPSPDCTGVGPQGRCAGDTLTVCNAGAAQATDCAATGQVCGYGGDDVGYVCAPPGAMGAFDVRGVVWYDDRPPVPGGLGPLTTQPVRGAAIAVVSEADGAVLAAAVTSDDGSYLLRYDAPPGALVRVVVATGSALPARPIRVLRPDGLLHGFATPAMTPGTSEVFDFVATDASGASEAFNVFDQLVLGMDALRSMTGVAAPEPLDAVWVRGGADGTYYWDAANAMFLLGDPADDDGYDDAVVLHEMGHYVEDAYGRSDSPGGFHDGTPTDPNLAWSEGFATWWAMATRGVPVYMDSNSGGGWSFDGESSVTSANPTGGMLQDVSEDMVTEILWDTGDAPGGDDDPMLAGTPAQVLEVEHLYAPSGQFDDRGEGGMDLVDWLDGWFLREGLGSCDAIREVVTGARDFPYDYAGLGGACP